MATETMDRPAPYEPNASEARTDLKRWVGGRKRLAAAATATGTEPPPLSWVATAVEVLLEELEHYEDANDGMVVTDLNTERS